jgi:hypothetical protein
MFAMEQQILHVGTNDIGNGLCSKLITQYYCNLLELITHNFSNIKIIMSAILPRPIDFDIYMLAPEIDSTSIQSMLFTYLQVESETNKTNFFECEAPAMKVNEKSCFKEN